MAHQRPTSSSLADPPKFCTVIIDQEANSLKIEEEFARRHGHDLPRTVFLKVHASDKLWEVEVFKAVNGEVLFKNGWEEFKEYYGVKLGSFLVFIFDVCSSKFDVFVYDMTSTHIDESDEETGSESDGGLGEISASQKRKCKRDVMVFRQEQGSMRKRPGFSFEKSTDDDIENNEDNASLSSDQAGGSRIGVTQNPTYIKQLTVHESYTLRLPKYFTKGIRALSCMILKDEKGRELKVNLVRGIRGYILGAGWNDFLVNNKVTIGSTLSFDFVSSSCNTIEVVVVKMATDKTKLFEYVRKRRGKPVIVASHDHSRKNPGDHTKNDEDKDNVTNQGGSSSHTKCRFSKQIMFYNRHRFELPKDFIKSTGISSHEKIIMKNVEGREWPVQNTCRTNDRCTLGSGWHDFLIDNKVIVGSTLDFQFVSNSKSIIIEARVVKPGANRNELFSYVRRSGSRRQIVTSPDQARGRKPTKVLTNVDSENDERTRDQENGPRVGINRTFSKKMKAHHAYKLDIPKDFVKETGIEANSKIRLKVESGEEWLIEVTSDKRGYRYSMTAGWKDFLEDNKIFEGSTLSFEFIPNFDNLIEVQVLENGTRGKPLFANSKLSSNL